MSQTESSQIPVGTTPSVGWIGLGSMGLAMALNIQRHLKATGAPNVHYWNRTIIKGKELEDIGGIPCKQAADVPRNCDITFISVSDDQTLHHIADQLCTLGPSLLGKVIVDTTTVHPSTTTSISTQLTQHGALYLAAPVFGSTPVAQAGQLLVALAGPDKAITATTPFLTGVIARAVLHTGTDPAHALLLKTTSNMLTAGLTYLIAEAHTLAEVSGLPSSTLESLIEHNLGAYAHAVSKRLTTGAYVPARGKAPQSSLDLGIKDVQHGVDLARSSGMRLDVAEAYVGAAREAGEWGAEKGRALDSSAVFGVVRRRAGLEFESEVVRGRDKEV